MNKIDIYFKSLVTKLKEKIAKNFSDAFFRDNVSRSILIAGAFLVVVAWSISIFYFKISDYEVPIRYNSFLGVTRLGSWYSLYELPLFLTVSLVVNAFLGKTIYKKDKLVSYLLTATNIFLGVITIILIINFGKLTGSTL